MIGDILLHLLRVLCSVDGVVDAKVKTVVDKLVELGQSSTSQEASDAAAATIALSEAPCTSMPSYHLFILQ